MAYSRYTPGTGQAFRPPQQQRIAQQPAPTASLADAKLGEIQSGRKLLQSGFDSDNKTPIGYFRRQEIEQQIRDAQQTGLAYLGDTNLELAQAQDSWAKKQAWNENQNPTIYRGQRNSNEEQQTNLKTMYGVGAEAAVRAGGRSMFAGGDQQYNELMKAEADGVAISGNLKNKAKFLRDDWAGADSVFGQAPSDSPVALSKIAGAFSYGSQGMGAGQGTGSPSWVVPGIADSDNPISGGSTGAPQSQGEQRQYEDLLNKQRHDPGIFQDFDRAGMSADLQKSYKKFAPTNMGAADNYNPQRPQGIMSPATGGPVGAPGQLAQRPGVFTNPMQRWTNEDGSRELKFDSNGMASGEDGRYTPASGLYMKGRPENGGKRYSSVNEYAADRGLGINDGTDPRRQYGEGQTGAGAGPIASAAYDGKLNPNDVARWASQGVKGDYMDRMITSHGGVLPRTAQQDMDSRGYTAKNGFGASMGGDPSRYISHDQFDGENSHQPNPLAPPPIGPGSIASPDRSSWSKGGSADITNQERDAAAADQKWAADNAASMTQRPGKKKGIFQVMTDPLRGSGQSWQKQAPPAPSPVPSGTPGTPGSAPEPSPVPKGIPGVPNSGTGDGIKADSQLGDAPKQKKGLLDVLTGPLDGVIKSYQRMPNEKVDALLEKYGHDQIETSHMGLAAKRKMLEHLEKTGVAQKPEGILATPGGEIMGASGTVTNSATSPANDVFERQNDVADHGNYDGRAMSMDRSGMLEGRLNAQMGVSSVPHTPVDGWALSPKQLRQHEPKDGPAPKDGWAVKKLMLKSDGYKGLEKSPGLLSGKDMKGTKLEDIRDRPAVLSHDGNRQKYGDYGTEYSATILDKKRGMAVVVPTIYDGAHHSEQEAAQRYEKTKQHMGAFNLAQEQNTHFANSEAYSQKLHERPQYTQDGHLYRGPNAQPKTLQGGVSNQKVSPVTRGFQKLSQMNPAAAELFRRAYAARH